MAKEERTLSANLRPHKAARVTKEAQSNLSQVDNAANWDRCYMRKPVEERDEAKKRRKDHNQSTAEDSDYYNVDDPHIDDDALGTTTVQSVQSDAVEQISDADVSVVIPETSDAASSVNDTEKDVVIFNNVINPENPIIPEVAPNHVMSGNVLDYPSRPKLPKLGDSSQMNPKQSNRQKWKCPTKCGCKDIYQYCDFWEEHRISSVVDARRKLKEIQ